MSAESFLDTNVLVYAAAGRGAEEVKRRRALELIENEDICLSAQVLQEFFVTVVRKVAVPLPVETALEWIEALEAFPCAAIDSSLVKIAIETSVRDRLSYWDAAIIAAAETLGARVVYSEDLAHGRSYGTVQVRNPFRARP